MTATAKQKAKPVSEEDLQDIRDMLGSAHAFADLINTTWEAEYRRDVAMLFDAIGQRDGIINDLQQDQVAYNYGKQEAFAQVLSLLRKSRGIWSEAERKQGGEERHKSLGNVQACNRFIDAVLGMAGLFPGEKPPPLPPEQARAENQRLRLALERVGLAIDGVITTASGSAVIREVREALNEAGV